MYGSKPPTLTFGFFHGILHRMEPTLKDTVVIYHADCYDGFGGAYAAWKKFGDTATYLPRPMPAPVPEGLTDKDVYIIDYSYDRATLEALRTVNRSVLVIDHHQTARAAVTAFPENIFDEGHSGAVLAWHHFHPAVPVPEILLYVEDHDIWKLTLPEHREFNAALHQVPRTFADWDQLSHTLMNPAARAEFIKTGAVITQFEDRLVADLLSFRELVTFEGKDVYAINVSRIYRSVLGNRLAELNEAEGREPLGIVYYHSKGGVNVSLRSKGDIDVAAIAERYGGGGHKHAASIRVSDFANLPFTFTPTA